MNTTTNTRGVDAGMLRNVFGSIVKSMRATARAWGPTRNAQVIETWADEIETTLEAALSAPEPAARVPEEATDEFVPRWWDDSHGGAYKEGWNDCRAAMLTASPAPSEGGKGVDAVSRYVPAKTCQCLTIGQRKYCLDRHVCSMPETQCSTGAAR